MTRFLPVVVLLAGWILMPAPVHADVRDAAEVQKTAKDVLADSEYRHLFRPKPEPKAAEDIQLPEWLEWFFEKLFGFFEWLFDGRSSAVDAPALTFGGFLRYLVILVLAVLIVAMLIVLLKRREFSQSETLAADGTGEEALSPSRPPGDIPMNEYERRALAAAQGGDFRSAVRELVLGSMSWTERAGLIRYRRGLSNRDYVRAVRRRLQQRESLLHIVSAFERVFYGRRVADVTTFKSCLEEFRKSFSLEATDANPAR